MKAVINSILFVFFILLACSPDELPKTYNYQPADLNALEIDLLQQVNQYRVECKLIPLAADQTATNLVALHIDYMIAAGLASHDNFPDRNITLINLGASQVQEIITKGQYNPTQALVGILKSEAHKKALMVKDLNACGLKIKDRYYIIILFKI